VTTHDFTGLGRHLKLKAARAPGDFHLVHYDESVRVGDFVLLGTSPIDAQRFKVIESKPIWRVVDQWCVTLRKCPEAVYVLGRNISR
jgi:hypothetical protein